MYWTTQGWFLGLGKALHIVDDQGQRSILLRVRYSAYKAFYHRHARSASSLHYPRESLTNRIDKLAFYSIYNMDVPLHSSGPMSRAHYAIVRKVESASAI